MVCSHDDMLGDSLPFVLLLNVLRAENFPGCRANEYCIILGWEMGSIESKLDIRRKHLYLPPRKPSGCLWALFRHMPPILAKEVGRFTKERIRFNECHCNQVHPSHHLPAWFLPLHALKCPHSSHCLPCPSYHHPTPLPYLSLVDGVLCVSKCMWLPVDRLLAAWHSPSGQSSATHQIQALLPGSGQFHQQGTFRWCFQSNRIGLYIFFHWDKMF